MKLDSLEDVFVHQLNDLYSAEDQLVEALPKMAKAASNEELKEAFEHHLQETRDHRDRVQEIFGQLGKRRAGTECKAMKGLIEEGEEVIKTSGGDSAAKDAALIAAAQRVEHYEIAAYGTARTLAGELGRWHALQADLPALNRQLKAARLAPLRPDLAPPRDRNAADED